MKEMTPIAVRERLALRPTLLVPVGTTEQHGPHLPLGCDTIIVERLADDLSARFGVVRAPVLEYGVHAAIQRLPGGAALRRRTLHRVMNELIESWEHGAAVREFIVLTAQASEGHLEALSTIRLDAATVTVIDVFDLDLSEVLPDAIGPVHGGEADTSLLLYLAPELVRMELAQDFAPPPDATRAGRRWADRLLAGSPGSIGFPTRADARKGERLYTFILDRVGRCLHRPEPEGTACAPPA
jgi:creatinine amidohydrolase